MRIIKISGLLGAAISLILLYACAAMDPGYEIPAQHPKDAELGKRNPICTDCHDPAGAQMVYKRFNHTVYFAENHRHEAYQHERVCAMCHKQNFCDDCHAVRVELKPSLKNQTDNYRRMPHRGDYLTRHRIDGRIDPVPCYRCHGNPKTNKTCVRCHG